jgi:RNA-binding protein
MGKLKGSQRRYLRSLANQMKPVVFVGKSGLSDAVVTALDEALGNHELVKVRFLEYKDQKKALSAEIETLCACEVVGMVGHVALFYRQHEDPDKRTIELPA